MRLCMIFQMYTTPTVVGQPDNPTDWNIPTPFCPCHVSTWWRCTNFLFSITFVLNNHFFFYFAPLPKWPTSQRAQREQQTNQATNSYLTLARSCIMVLRSAFATTITALAVFSLIYCVLLVQQWAARRSLPIVNPQLDAYSRCVAKFLEDLTTYSECVDLHSSKKCFFDDHLMTNSEDGHNCLALITSVPHLSLNAVLIKAAHDVCYTYLRSVGECLGFAVELDEFLPCFRKEVFARTALVIQRCKNESGATDDDISGLGNPIPPLFSF